MAIKSETIKIGLDMTDFNKGIKSSTKEINEIKKQASELQKGLDLKYDPTRFVEAQKLLQKALSETGDKATVISKKMQELEKAGVDVDSVSYQKLRTELIKTENQTVLLEKKLKDLNNIKFTQLGDKFTKLGAGITSAGKALLPLSLIASAGVAGLSALGLSAVKTADDIATLASQSGMTAEEIQKLQYLAIQTDVPFESLRKSFVKARATLAEFASGGTSIATKALEKLGLSLENFDSADSYFDAVLKSLAEIPNELERVNIANDIFGEKLGNELLPLLNIGAKGISELAEEFGSLGAMTNEQVAKLAEFDNVLNKIKVQLKNLFMQIGIALLPVMEKLAQIINNSILPMFEKWVESAKKLSDSQIETGLKILLVVAALAPLLLIMGKVVTMIGGLISIIPKLGSALSLLAMNPVVAALTAIAVVIGILFLKNEEFRSSIMSLVSTLGSALAPILETLSNVFKTLLSSLMPIINILGELLNMILTPLIAVITPIITMFGNLTKILMPLLTMALLPITNALTFLQIPLKLLSELLKPLTNLFLIFGNVIESIFNKVMSVVLDVTNFLEGAINKIIGFINTVIDGFNSFGKFLGLTIPKLNEVNINANQNNGITNNNPAFKNDILGSTQSGNNNTYNDNRSPEINIVVNNYGNDVDVDDLVTRVNIALARGM